MMVEGKKQPQDGVTRMGAGDGDGYRVQRVGEGACRKTSTKTENDSKVRRRKYPSQVGSVASRAVVGGGTDPLHSSGARKRELAPAEVYERFTSETESFSGKVNSSR